MYRPMSLFRILEPLSGSPTVRVACKPVQGWSKESAKSVRGNSHLRWDIRDDALRLVTNMPLTYLCEESTFHLKEKIYFGLTWSTGIEEDLVQVAERFLAQTAQYWQTWVKHCSVPSLFQKETIRSALALKLHCFEDTGAILAATTTSLPEEPGSGRNWDYRFCWLRDAHFVLSAFHNLGHFEEMEGFLKFLMGIAQKHEASRERLAPVYTLSQDLPLPETIRSNWRGYDGGGTVRTMNQAAEHIQNDVYGEIILTLAPIYFDERFLHLRNREHEEMLYHFAKLCARSISKPDAGLWEIRDGWQEHSFTNLMAWAGLERTARIHANKGIGHPPIDLEHARDHAMKALEKAVKDGSLRNGPNDDTLDASLALSTVLRLPNEELCRLTTEKIREHLALGKEGVESSYFYRYVRQDDFGHPHSAFLICSFWVAQSLARLGDKKGAEKILKDVVKSANHLGLFAEHFLPSKNTQLGNFPQAYSHVGLINAAFALSPTWSEVL